MKAVIFINGSGADYHHVARLAVGSGPGRKLAAKGIENYIAYEVPMELVEARYGYHFHALMSDLKQDDDLRVMDFDGHRIFHHFAFADFVKSRHGCRVLSVVQQRGGVVQLEWLQKVVPHQR